ncbi:MAG: DinB family protein [Gemmatimonadaceae bacterium]
MTISALLLPEYDSEITITRKVLERVPDDKAEWKPHPKSFMMAHLAQLVAMLPDWVVKTLEQTELDLAPKDKPRGSGYTIEKTSTLVAMFDKNATAGRAALAKATDADFQVPWTLKAGGNPVLTQPRYMILRQMVLNHLVHHRAQLGVYLRLVDQKVPQMYGPTADDRWPGI